MPDNLSTRLIDDIARLLESLHRRTAALAAGEPTLLHVWGKRLNDDYRSRGSLLPHDPGECWFWHVGDMEWKAGFIEGCLWNPASGFFYADGVKAQGDVTHGWIVYHAHRTSTQPPPPPVNPHHLECV